MLCQLAAVDCLNGTGLISLKCKYTNTVSDSFYVLYSIGNHLNFKRCLFIFLDSRKLWKNYFTTVLNKKGLTYFVCLLIDLVKNPSCGAHRCAEVNVSKVPKAASLIVVLTSNKCSQMLMTHLTIICTNAHQFTGNLFQAVTCFLWHTIVVHVSVFCLFRLNL